MHSVYRLNDTNDISKLVAFEFSHSVYEYIRCNCKVHRPSHLRQEVWEIQSRMTGTFSVPQRCMKIILQTDYVQFYCPLCIRGLLGNSHTSPGIKRGDFNRDNHDV